MTRNGIGRRVREGLPLVPFFALVFFFLVIPTVTVIISAFYLDGVFSFDRVQREVGTTTLFVTHDHEEALAVADRVGVMNEGRLEQLAAPADLYTHPIMPFVAGFVGLNNKIAAEVSGETADVLGSRVPVLEGSIRSGSGVAMVRPEAVDVSPDPEGRVSVVSVEFLGPFSRVHLMTEGGGPVVAHMSSVEARALRPGEPVSVRVEPSDVLVVAG